MADKGDTYYCSWKREADGSYIGWEIRDPKLRANAGSIPDLMQALGRVIEQRYDDQEAALNFDPPLSQGGDPAWFADGYVLLTWNATFKFRPSAQTAYTGGRCQRCGGGIGPRSSDPLVIDEMTGLTDGAFSPQSNEPPPNRNMPAHLIILSEEFLSLLTKEERSTFQLRPIKWEGKQRRPFFEVIANTLLRFGAIKGLEDGWQCDRCHRRSFSHGSALGWGVEVICKQDLPSPTPDLFLRRRSDRCEPVLHV